MLTATTCKRLFTDVGLLYKKYGGVYSKADSHSEVHCVFRSAFIPQYHRPQKVFESEGPNRGDDAGTAEGSSGGECGRGSPPPPASSRNGGPWYYSPGKF